MRIRLCLVAAALSVLSSASLHADTILDYVISGHGYTVSFSIPKTFTPRTYDNLGFTIEAPISYNGVVKDSAIYFVFPRTNISFSSLDRTQGGYFTGEFTGVVFAPSFDPNFDPADPDHNTVTMLSPIEGLISNGGSGVGQFYHLSVEPEVGSNSPVPEPSTLVLLATGALGLGVNFRRRLA